MQIARIYLRVSTDEQELTRQNSIIEDARGRGFYVAGVDKEKASGARADRHKLQRLPMLIRDSCSLSGGVYGYRRVHSDLNEIGRNPQ